MIDTRALAQEVQDQLLAAMHRGQQQFRKSQDQMRKSQYHLRKSREAMAEAIRSGNQVAKAIRPNLPPLTTPADRAKLRADAHELAGQVMATQRQLADRAMQVTGPLAEQVVASQRQLADRALHAASPVVADRVAKLTHAVGTLPGIRRLSLADGVAAPEADAPSPADTIAEVREIRPTTAAAEPAPARAKASKPRTPRGSTTKAAGTTKSRATSAAGTAKSARATRAASTTKAAGTSKTAGTSKSRSTKAAGTTRTARTSKPRSTKN